MCILNKLLVLTLIGAFASFAAAAEEEPIFEIINKHGKKIWLILAISKDPLAPANKYEQSQGPMEIQSEGTKAFRKGHGLDMKDMIRIYIDFDSKPRSLYEHDLEYRFPNAVGLTKYVTFNPSKSTDSKKWLYPQIGTYLGLSGKSASGHSLKNNIKDVNVNPVKAFTGKLP